MDINLTRASALLLFTDALGDSAVSLDAALHRCWLPLSANLDASTPVVEERVWLFVESTARLCGQADLGWRTGLQRGFEPLGSFGVALASQPDLSAALKLLTAGMVRYSSVSAPALYEEGGLVWLRRGSLPGKGQWFWQVEQYAAAAYLGIMRHYIGPGWSPPRMRVQGPTRLVSKSALADTCPAIEGGCQILEIAIEPELLKPGATRPAFIPPAMGEKLTPLPDSYGEAIAEVLRPYLPDYPLNLKTTAHILQLHPHSVMRRLATEGLRFRDIRDSLREERGRQLLTQTRLPVAEISRILEYSHPGHFSRAMKRMTGLTPREIRNAT